MKNISFLCTFICVHFAFFAQQIFVFEKETNEPLTDVQVYSESPYFKGYTDKKGTVKIPENAKFPTLIFYKSGYKKLNFSSEQLQQMKFKVELQTAYMDLSEMVVSATRWNQSSWDIPSKINLIKKEDIYLLQPQTAADLLANSGEVFIQKSQQGGGSPMIRGFATNRLLYTVDGVRMNNAIFRGGNIQNVISLDPLAIESAEVLFGAHSVIYGSDAIGGVMSFRTLRPRFSNDKTLVKGNALFRYSSANQERSAHADVSVGGKKWASVTSLSHNHFGDLRMGSRGRDEYLRTFYIQRIDGEDKIITNDNPLIQRPSGYDQVNLMQKVAFKATENLQLDYGFHYSETSSYSRYDRLIEVNSAGVPRSAVWNYGPQKWMMNNLNLTFTKKNLFFNELSVKLAQQFFEESRIDRNFTGGNKNRLRTQEERVLAYSANIDFEKLLGKHRLFYGLEGILNDVKSEGSAINIVTQAPIAVADRYPQASWSSYGAYLSSEIHLLSNLKMNAGVRYNAYQVNADFTRNLAFFPFPFSTANVSNGAATGSLGLVYHPTEKWKITVNGSTGFRAPNVDDMGKIFDLGPQEIVIPNTTLKAEYAYTGEIGISKIFGDFLKIDANGFYTFLDNALVRRTFQLNGQDSILFDDELSQVFAIQNAAFARVYGFHLGGEIKLPHGFKLSAHYNYQKGIEEMDNGTESPSRHAAPAFGIARLHYKIKDIEFQFYTQFSAGFSYDELNIEEQQKPAIYAKDELGRPFSPSWYTLNFKTQYAINSTLFLTAGIENLLDVRYKTYSSGLVAPGRNFVIALRGSF